MMAAMSDKDVAGVIRALAASPVLRGATILATSLPALARAMPAAELAATWRRQAPGLASVAAVDDPLVALERALAASAGGGTTIVAGSLYLVGLVRGRLVDDPALRDPES